MSTIKHLFTNSTCEANGEAVVSAGSGPNTSREQNELQSCEDYVQKHAEIGEHLARHEPTSNSMIMEEKPQDEISLSENQELDQDDSEL
jgi:hypothetical protein